MNDFNKKKCIVENCPYLALWGAEHCKNHIDFNEKYKAKLRIEDYIKNEKNLIGASLQNMDLSGIDFKKCDLTNSLLQEADLEKSNFSNTILENTAFFHTNRLGTLFPEYFNVELLNKYDKINSKLDNAINILRKLDTVGYVGFPTETVGFHHEFDIIANLLKDTELKIDPQWELQRAMNKIWDLYLDFEKKYLIRQYPSKIVEIVDKELMAWIKKHPKDLYKINSETFEKIVSEVFSSFGFNCEITSKTRDGGFDLIGLHQAGPVDTKIIVEAKRYNVDKKIDVGIVRKMFASMVDNNASHGFIVTTSHFTKPAQKWAEKYSFLPNSRKSVYRLELVDFERLNEWIKGYVELKSNETD